MTDPTPRLLAEINKIYTMEADEILRVYSRFFSSNSTRGVVSLRQEAIYRIQEEHYRITLSAKAIEILNGSLEKRVEKKTQREPHAPGTRYIREWKGEKHVLTYRGPKQYEYLGQTYRSPSVVAKMITGTNWNGREFFHLPPLKDSK